MGQQASGGEGLTARSMAARRIWDGPPPASASLYAPVYSLPPMALPALTENQYTPLGQFLVLVAYATAAAAVAYAVYRFFFGSPAASSAGSAPSAAGGAASAPATGAVTSSTASDAKPSLLDRWIFLPLLRRMQRLTLFLRSSSSSSPSSPLVSCRAASQPSVVSTPQQSPASATAAAATEDPLGLGVAPLSASVCVSSSN